MFKSIQTRAMFFLVSLSISLLIVLGYVIIASTENIGHDMKSTALEERSVLLSQLIKSNYLQKNVELSPAKSYSLLLKTNELPSKIIQETFMINKDGNTIGYYDKEVPYNLNFKDQSDEQVIYKNGQDYIVGLSSLADIPGLEGWYIVTEESFSSSFAKINNIKTVAIILITALLFVFWPLSKKFSFYITNPIKDLSAAASQIAAGDISHEITVKKNDELADIAASFNAMLNNLKSTMRQVLAKSGEAASMHEIMEYVEQAYDNLPGGIISINNIGEITTFNEVASDLIGIKESEVLGLDIKNPYPKEIKPLIDPLRRCLAKGSIKLKTITDIFSVSGEKIPILYSINIQFGLKNEVIGAVCVFRRIEDIKRFEESANRAKNLESLGEMAASLAHEIKNPLTSIRGYAQLIKLDLSEKKLNLEELDIIMHETDRLTLMLDRFLNFARPKIPELVPIDLTQMVKYVLTLTQNDLPHNIKINTNYQGTPKVMVDAELFEPVILNLVLNAIQAMPNGGAIDIKTGYNDMRKMVYLEVRDNGIGIPIEISEKIFEPFFTTKVNGVGMGLAISSRIIEAHKGILEVESVVGQMTKFTILLQSVEDKSYQDFQEE
ncbi:ATP-binding protein [Clostridium aminobutyricum]|uniref:histidine kinase n=1 Tax=Clostridium aminobutyricum TaxID=33953 RepID=A0A939D8Y7_CLOAM|nr:ATP-binding protein [Clostridium aminobutyricum]MBN7773649.1 HAMP domain-containing protein [Clostridium aminobutyricum]